MTPGNPFSEYDADLNIGHLKWRMQRRGGVMRESQDGVVIGDLEMRQAQDCAELAALEAARQKTTST
jgi:hypothetical protein